MDKVYVHHSEYREAKPVQSEPTQPVASLFRLDNRTIVVTGGSGAIGATLAAAILEAGADVVVLDLPEKPVEKFWGKHTLSSSVPRPHHHTVQVNPHQPLSKQPPQPPPPLSPTTPAT